MFSGIIEAKGSIVGVRRHNDDLSIDVDVGDMPVADVAIGDSIAISGPCLTVTVISGSVLSFDLSGETVRRTHFGDVALGQVVNLERSMKIGGEVNGHLVSGHVDGLGRIVGHEADGRSTRLDIEAKRALAPFIAEKGSISVDGISLTINSVDDGVDSVGFSVNIIPHTIDATSLSTSHVGQRVHLEVDMIARYVHRMLALKDVLTNSD